MKTRKWEHNEIGTEEGSGTERGGCGGCSRWGGPGRPLAGGDFGVRPET